jgi:hypothetical protein
MKRAITALTLVCALMLSVVACQVYNPTNNETLYTAMRTEGAISWADYSKKFEEADGDQKYEILMEYEAFRKLEGDKEFWDDKTKWIELYKTFRPAYDEAKKAYDEAKKAYDEAAAVVVKAGALVTKEQVEAEKDKKTALESAEATLNSATAPLTDFYGSVEGLKTLWDKEYDVLWDWNSKL